jgi:hypothetical protein
VARARLFASLAGFPVATHDPNFFRLKLLDGQVLAERLVWAFEGRHGTFCGIHAWQRRRAHHDHHWFDCIGYLHGAQGNVATSAAPVEHPASSTASSTASVTETSIATTAAVASVAAAASTRKERI